MSDYIIDVYDRPGLTLPDKEKQTLQTDICTLAAQYLKPLPRYQVFDTASPSALDDKVIITARTSGGELIGFSSAVLIPIPSLAEPVLHTGVSVVHESYRRSNVKRLLFSNLFLHILSDHPQGIWLTSLAEVLTSLVHIARYTTRVFPSPTWAAETSSPRPSAVHLLIARDISAHHRSKMLIAPDAQFDEERFVFLGSNDFPPARVFMKDVDDAAYWHRDRAATDYFRRFFRRGRGDEVLQVARLDMGRIMEAMQQEGFTKDEDGRIAKL